MSVFRLPRGLAIYGASGLIGSQYRRLHSDSVVLSRHRSFLSQIQEVDSKSAKQWDVFFLCGLTDPSLGSEALLRANVEFPLSVMDEVRGAGIAERFRFFTVGTVHEAFEEMVSRNAYVSSKHLLSEKIRPFGNVTHLRLHTAFGGENRPAPHLFLGQILGALEACAPFPMSSGKALREYHHVDDLIGAFEAIRGAKTEQVLTLSHGESLPLSEIATEVFRAFDSARLLQIGAKADRLGDNFGVRFERSDSAVYPQARKTLPAIVAYLKQF